MKRVAIAGALAVLLLGTVAVVWSALNLPPVAWVVEYGPPSAHGPTGRTAIVEKVEFVEIAPGYFRAGSALHEETGDLIGRLAPALGRDWGRPPEPSDEMPVRWVRFPTGFWIARFEISNEEYLRYDPKHRKVDGKPVREIDSVDYVTWEEAKNYCTWLATVSGLQVRLPTEEEYECACRGGTRTEYPFGDDAAGIVDFAWCSLNSERLPHPSGLWMGNAWGLQDLTGNQAEWCEEAADPPPPGPASAPWLLPSRTPAVERILRGGSWASSVQDCRSAARATHRARGYRPWIGFRPVFVLPAGQDWPISLFLVITEDETDE